jgi:hypothetical protein
MFDEARYQVKTSRNVIVTSESIISRELNEDVRVLEFNGSSDFELFRGRKGAG